MGRRLELRVVMGRMVVETERSFGAVLQTSG